MIHFQTEEKVLLFLEQLGWFCKKTERGFQFYTDPIDSPYFIEDVVFEEKTLEGVKRLANELYEGVKEQFSEEGELDWLYDWIEKHLDVHQFKIEE